MDSGSTDSGKLAAEESGAELKLKLLRSLRPAATIETIAISIQEFVSDPKNRRLSADVFSKILAQHLTSRWVFGLKKQNALERLIHNRAAELGALIQSSDRDALERLVEGLRHLPPQKRFRAKIESDKQRKARSAASKNRYDRSRRDRQTAVGLIERDFGELDPVSTNATQSQRSASSTLQQMLLSGKGSAHSPAVWPTGPCLDEVMKGREVPMAGTYSSLQNLFGRGRDSLPPGLPHRREGRRILYDYRAVLQCMEALLDKESPEPRWLKDLTRRRLVLTGIIARAFQAGTPKIRDAFVATLRRHLR